MSEQETTTVEERTLAGLDKLVETMELRAQRAEAEMIDTVNSALERNLTPDTSRLKALFDGKDEKVDALAGARARSPYAFEYERMKVSDPEQAVWRDEDSDHWMSQWIMANQTRNAPALKEATAQLEARFGRALQLEGVQTPGAFGGTDGNAGELLPIPLANLIMLQRQRAARIRPITRTFTTSGKAMRVPTSDAVTASMVLEGATASTSDPNIGQQILDKKKAQVMFAASVELTEDSQFNLTTFFSERAGSAIAELEDVQFCTSNGTEPNISGNIHQNLTEFNEATLNTIAYEDVVGLYFALNEPYRAGASWLGSHDMMAFLSLLVDGNGRPLFQPAGTAAANVVGNVSGNVGTIFGRPVYDVPLPPGTLLFTNQMEAYAILDGGGIRARASEHALWDTDSISWKFTMRFDGNYMTQDAGVKMLGITSVA